MVLRVRGKQPPALPSRSVGKMPVAIWSESGAADAPLHPHRLCCRRVWGMVQPPLCLVIWGRGADFFNLCKLLLLGWERLMPHACASFYCLLLHPCMGR